MLWKKNLFTVVTCFPITLMLGTVTTTTQAAVTLETDEYLVFYHHDALGSPVGATDEKGRLLWRESSLPYGKSTTKTSESGLSLVETQGADNETRLGYTGHSFDGGSDLVYMKARFYDPAIGRFYSNDPIGYLTFDQSMFNRYAYVANNPFNRTDPTGMYGPDYTAEDMDGIDDYINYDIDIESGTKSAYDDYAAMDRTHAKGEREISYEDTRENWKGDANEMLFDASKIKMKRTTVIYQCQHTGGATNCANFKPESGKQARVHGTVTGELYDGKWSILSEKYNFEQRPDGTFARNLLTFGAAIHHGSGEAFGMHYINEPAISE